MWDGGQRQFSPDPNVSNQRLVAMNKHLRSVIHDRDEEMWSNLMGRIPLSLSIEWFDDYFVRLRRDGCKDGLTDFCEKD